MIHPMTRTGLEYHSWGEMKDVLPNLCLTLIDT